MSDTFSRAYITLKSKTSDYLATSKRALLAPPETLSIETVDFQPSIGCKLSAEAVEKSVDQIGKSNSKRQQAKALLVVGTALLLIGCWYAFSSYPTFAKNASQITWALRSILAIGIPSLAVIASRVILNVERSREIPSLPDLQNGGFETKEMRATYERFRLWALKQSPKLLFALSDNRFLTLPNEIWSSPHLPAILLGTERQRNNFINPRQYSLSSLVIAKTD